MQKKPNAVNAPATAKSSASSVLEKMSGSRSRDFAELLLGQAIAANQGVSKDLNPGKAVLDAMSELEPADPLEAALMSQALTVHHSAMKQMSKAANADLPEIREQWLRLSTKLMSLYARQLEALSKYQRKGGQNMTVRHIRVESGGKAILGSVTHSRGRGTDE